VKSIVKIPTTNLGYRWKIVSTSKSNSDQHPEISIWPPKPEIITSVELTDSVELPTPNSGFSMMTPRKKISQMITTTIDYQKLYDWRARCLYCHFRLSIVVAIARGQLLRAEPSRKPLVCHWNCRPICHSSRYISISGFEGHIAISACRSLSQSPSISFFALSVVENPRFAVGIVILSVTVQEI